MDFFSKTPAEQLTELEKLHRIELKTCKQIADELGTYPKRIYRLCEKIGFEFDRASEHYRKRKDGGLYVHPQTGKTLSQDVKDKISHSQGEKHASLSASEKKAKLESYRKNYNLKTSAEKAEFHRKSQKAIRESSKHGSKLESYLAEKLGEKGFGCILHASQTMMNEKLHIDIFIPSKGIAIEVDGPFHSQKIWNDNVLKTKKKSDKQKNDLCIRNGISVIRVSTLGKFSKYKGDCIFKLILPVVEEISKKKYGEDRTVHYVDGVNYK